MNKKKNKKIWRWIVVALVIFGGWFTLRPSFELNQTIELKAGESAQVFFQSLDWNHRIQVKMYVKNHNTDFSTIDAGNYIFSGSYTPASFVETILAGPQIDYATITVLEWWSIYDIDSSLSAKWLISNWDYIAFVTNPSIISKYKERYPFLKSISTLTTLEGFLYPDTYKVDKEWNIIDQLVYLQLEAFNKTVWNSATQLLDKQKLSRYEAMTLASIVEKEERNDSNKATVAWILLKRFQIGTLIWADVSLCYYFKQPYKLCTPAVIGQNVKDSTNPYNTRALKWMPPTPISNPNISSILAVLQPQETPYFFYLHDDKWAIHYATTLDEHNQNKKFYIK